MKDAVPPKATMLNVFIVRLVIVSILRKAVRTLLIKESLNVVLSDKINIIWIPLAFVKELDVILSPMMNL